MPYVISYRYALAGILLFAASALEIYLISGKKPAGWVYALTPAVALAMCWFTRSVMWGGNGGGPGFASGCADEMRRLTDSVRWPHDETAGLVKALLTGDRSALAGDTVQAFRRSGASHILALSGLHLGIIYATVSRLLWIAGRSPAAKRLKSFVIVLSCGFYTLMTGWNASTVRALLFIAIREISSLDPRRYPRPGRTLLCALAVQFVLNPTVVTQVGFQLSYLAVTGIILFYPELERWFPAGKSNPLKFIWNSAAMSVSCQILTAPLCWFYFHTFPIHFLLTNLLALPLTGVGVTLAVITVVLEGCGLRTSIMPAATDAVITALVSVLKIISSM